jgi:hypothetical protein
MECSGNAAHDTVEVVQHLLVANAEDPHAEPGEDAVPFLVDVVAVVVHAAIDFDDEVSRRAEEVRDETVR